MEYKSEIVGDTACPSCREMGKDKTGNHLILFEDGGAYCNRCHYRTNWKEDKLELAPRKEITEQEWKESLDDFNQCTSGAIPARGIYKSTAEYYGIKLGTHPTNRQKIGSYLFPHRDKSGDVICYQVRIADKKQFFNVGYPKRVDTFFGQHLIPKGKEITKLYIAESCIDTMSVYQAIKDSWKNKTSLKDANPYVVGLPHGTQCLTKLLSDNKELTDKCNEIVLMLDNDEAGAQAAEKAHMLLPDKIKVVKLPLKDPNEMVMSNRSDELAKLALFGSEKIKLDGACDIGDILSELLEPIPQGLSYPWATMTRLTYGIQPKQIIGFAGGVGIGKSEFKYHIAAHLASIHNEAIAVFDLEYNYKATSRKLISRILHKHLHKPDELIDEKELMEGGEKLAGKVKLYKYRGGKDWKEIKEYIRYFVVAEGVKYVFLDPITALVSHLNSSEANDMLNTIFSDLSSMTHELDFTLIYFAHLNPPKTGSSHERGGKVLESQLTGSRAMIKWSHYIWGLERNKDPDIPEYERNTTYVVLLKDREYGNVGKFPVFYSKETGDLVERF